MAIEHDAISNAELHEPKDIIGASVGQVYVSDGAGSGSWINVEGVNTVLVNGQSDLPTPVSGVITLDADTEYRFLQDVNLGTNRIVLSDNTVVSGIDSLITKITYTGGGNMFTTSTGKIRMKFLELECTAGTLWDATITSGSVFRMQDITYNCATFGTFVGSGGIIRFTLVSGTCTTQGMSLSGSFSTFLFDVAALTLNAGTFLNLGTATFDAFFARTVIATLGAGTTFLSGAAASANINAAGLGNLHQNRFSGTGTVLSGVTTDDARWEFSGNDDIADTRPDGLLSMQNNATATIIATANTPVIVAGTWAEETTSQFTGTTGGRLTYDGNKDFKGPITASVSVEPVSGSNVAMSAYIAVNGVVVANSKRSGTASSGSPTSITIPWQIVFSTNDYVEVFVENNDNTTNILVSSAILRVN